MTGRWLIFSLLLLAPDGALQAAEVPRAAVLDRTARATAHPRLFWTAAEDSAMHEKIRVDPRLKAAAEAAQLTADHMLGEAPVVYRKDGRRLLGRSREALGRMTHLGFAWRITGEQKYFDRALAELRAMAAMPDWNPSHFLDVAEMTLAAALGYDWLYPRLASEDRAWIKQALEEKGLAPYLEAAAKPGWERGRNNWNQVCHAGMVAGALALLEDDPGRAAEVIQRALEGLPAVMKVYNPDGNYPEGPAYWNYGTSFNVMLVAMLESALGTDFGLSQSPGFLKTGEFPLQTMGPTLLAFNFGDCGVGASFSPAMPWFAARTRQPELMWYEWELLERGIARVRSTKGRAQIERLFPLAMVWAEKNAPRRPPVEKVWHARGQNPLVIFRGSWTDPGAVFLAIKAGTPSASHGHMDSGSFVLDAAGARWSLDLGAQDYNQLEQRGIRLWDFSQESERWGIFRYHNRAHSTLMVNDASQRVTSQAPILECAANDAGGVAEVDLTETYADQLARARRTFTLAGRRVTIEDQLTATNTPAKVRWGMVTSATLKTAGSNEGWLELQGKRLRWEVISPRSVTLTSWPANPPPHDYDAPNPGVSVVGFEVPLAAGRSETIKVVLDCP